MANELTLPPPPAYLVGRGQNNADLTHGVGESFPVLSIRSGKFLIRYLGEEKPYLNPQGYASPTIDVIIVKAGKDITKSWYQKGYQQGDRDAPDCMSSDGKAPDPDAPNTPIDPRTGQRMQFCSVCPNNIFGSSPARPDGKGGLIGGAGKACSDTRRLVLLIPPHALNGEITPVMVRVPPTSLKPLAEYGRMLERSGYNYDSVYTRLSFDTLDAKGNQVGYPLLKLEFAGVVSQGDLMTVDKMAVDPKVERILHAKVDGVNADVPNAAIAAAFQQPQGYLNVAEPAPSMFGGAAQPAPAPAPAPVVQPTPAPAAAPAGIIALPDGRFFNQATGQFVAPPEPPKPARPATVIELPDGKMYDTATGQYWQEGPAAPVAAPPAAVQPVTPEILRPGEQPPPTSFFGGAPVAEPKDVTPPTPAAAQKKVTRPRTVVAKTETQAAPEPAPASNGNGEDKTVTPAPAGVDSIISSLKGSGRPPE